MPTKTLIAIFVQISLLTVALSQKQTLAYPVLVNTLTARDAAILKRALSAYDNGRSREAEPLLRNLVERYPRNFDATETLGLIEMGNGEAATALRLLETACKLRPSSALALTNLGAAYLERARSKDAVLVLQHALSIDPRSPQVNSYLGQALMLTGNPAAAAKAFTRAGARDPGDPDLLYNLALSLFETGNASDAAGVLDRIPGKGSSAQIQSLLADIEEKQGHFEAAVKHFQSAAELDPSEANIFALGLEFARHWSFTAAIKIFEFGVSKYPGSARMKLGFGIAKYGNNDYNGASPVFSQLLQKSPQNNVYAELLGRSCSLISDQEKTGCDALVDFAKHHPKNATAATYAAEGILKQPRDNQDLSLAETLLNQAIKADPGFAEAYLRLAVCQQQRQKWQESITLLKKATALDPQLAEAHYRLARAYYRTGQREDAQREIALQQKYSEEHQAALNERLKTLTTFLVSLH